MKDKLYFIFLGLIIVFYVFYELQKPKEIDWSNTYHFNHEIPFGTAGTHQLLPDLFDDSPIGHSFETLYQFVNITGGEGSLLIMADEINFDPNDLNALFSYLEEDNAVMILSNNIGGQLADTLDFTTSINDFNLTVNPERIKESLTGTAKETISWVDGSSYDFATVATTAYFENKVGDSLNVLARNEEGLPVVLETSSFGGKLVISTLPLALTNFFVLDEKTTGFAADLLSLMPEGSGLTHNEYYQLGSLETRTPLRVLLANSSLKWAILLVLSGLLLFLVFESRRKQRPIPVINPLKNLSIEFAETLGRLYYRQSNHMKLAQKRLQFWKEYVRRTYNLRTEHLDENFRLDLSKKSGVEISTIQKLVNVFKMVENEGSINEGELMVMEKYLNEFYGITEYGKSGVI